MFTLGIKQVLVAWLIDESGEATVVPSIHEGLALSAVYDVFGAAAEAEKGGGIAGLGYALLFFD